MYNFIIVEFEPDNPITELKHPSFWRAILAELVATMIFVYIGTLVIITSGAPANGINAAENIVICIAFGFTIATLVGTIGSVSGGHMNPAVTLAFIVTRRITIFRGVCYMLAQMVGAIFGGGLTYGLTLGTDNHGLGSTTISYIGAWQGFGIEFFCTFLLVFVIFGTAVDANGPGNIAPILIGLAITAAMLPAVPFTGGSLNPARSFGPAVWAGAWKYHWIYWVGPMLGSLCSSLLYTHGCVGGIRPLAGEAERPGESSVTETGRVIDNNEGPTRGIDKMANPNN